MTVRLSLTDEERMRKAVREGKAVSISDLARDAIREKLNRVEAMPA